MSLPSPPALSVRRVSLVTPIDDAAHSPAIPSSVGSFWGCGIVLVVPDSRTSLSIRPQYPTVLKRMWVCFAFNVAANNSKSKKTRRVLPSGLGAIRGEVVQGRWPWLGTTNGQMQPNCPPGYRRCPTGEAILVYCEPHESDECPRLDQTSVLSSRGDVPEDHEQRQTAAADHF